MIKMLTIVGARPQFIKAAAVNRAIEKHNKNHPQNMIQEGLVHTGQHFDDNMSESFFRSLNISKPIVNLGVPGGLHGAATGNMLANLEAVFLEHQPNCVLVYGDTNSTLAAALAAAKIHIPVIHVEAGLRSFNKRMPEEINRILTDHVSDLLFCPTGTAEAHLKSENITQNVYISGDVMYDVAKQQANKSVPLDVDAPFALATLHRAENTDDSARLRAIFNGFAQAPDKIVLPLHPRTRKKITEANLTLPENVVTIDPVPYEQMIWALQNCEYVLTDSGGLQKEAYFFNKRCITLRDETEWTELLEHRVNRLVGFDTQKIVDAISWASQKGEFVSGIYGNGDASEKIVGIIANHYS